MQIHEVTLSKLKNAMVQGALKGAPGLGSLYNTPARADARLKAQTDQYVKDLAQQWINYANSAKLDQLAEAEVDPKGKVPFDQLSPALQQQILDKEKKAQPAAGGETAYKNAFLTWAEQKLRTTETKTGRAITMDNVKELPGVQNQLDQAVANIIKNRQDPAKLQPAVEEYFRLAVTATQQIAKSIRQKSVGSGAAHPPITVGTGPGAVVYIHNGQKYVNARTGQPLDPNLIK